MSDSYWMMHACMHGVPQTPSTIHIYTYVSAVCIVEEACPAGLHHSGFFLRKSPTNTCTLCKPLPLMKAAASCRNVWYFKENLWLVISAKEPWVLYVLLLTPQIVMYYRIISRILAIIVLLGNFTLGGPMERPQVSVPNYIIVGIPVVKHYILMALMIHSQTRLLQVFPMH